MENNLLIGIIKAKIINIGDVMTFNNNNRKSFSKRMLTIETEDNQKLFIEVRENLFDQVEFFRIGLNAIFYYKFAGSEKNGKQWNNIIANRIEVLHN